MDVFLVPVGHDRHELYCEVPDAVDPTAADPGRSGWWRRRVARFRAMLDEAEQERLRRERGDDAEGRGLWRWVLRHIAEAIAEQRLLWQLRRVPSARLVHPDYLRTEAAVAALRRQLSLDLAKHRRWLVIDAIAAAITGPLFFFVPGPNVVSWYFAFRTLGHYFAWRGATHGLQAVDWRPEGSAEVSALRQALTLAPLERRALLERLSEVLGLDHLASFIERVAARS